MVHKVFKFGECPHRRGVEVGSQSCRTCKDNKGEPAYCSFVICSFEVAEVPKPKPKRGRPPGKAKKKPVKRKTKTK